MFPPASFGPELRRLRIEAGYSLSQLAERVHYSKGQLSKIETGFQRPSAALARRCDAVLAADGALLRLAPQTAATPASDQGEQITTGDSMALRLNAESSGIVTIDVSAGTQPAYVLKSLLRLHSHAPAAFAGDSVPYLRGIFDNTRLLGQVVPAAMLLPTLVTQTHAAHLMIETASAADRPGLLRLTSRFAELAGWLAQVSGDDRAAVWWSDRASQLAAAGGDPHMGTYALVRRALITLYAQDAPQTIELARLARTGPASPRIRALAAQREAQGHAVAGDDYACRKALDDAAAWWNRSLQEESADPVIGTSTVTDPIAMTTGWCLYELGRVEAAVEVIDKQLGRLPERAVRARARYTARLALAVLAVGEVEQACQLADSVLAAAADSATIRHDLRLISRGIARWGKDPSARWLAPRLAAVLSPTI